MSESAAAALSKEEEEKEATSLKALQDILHNRIKQKKGRYTSLIVNRIQVAYQER
jgi:hypothetical protein